MKYYLAILEITSDDPNQFNGSIELNPELAGVLLKSNTSVNLTVKVVNGYLKAKVLRKWLLFKYFIAKLLKASAAITYGITIYDEKSAIKILKPTFQQTHPELEDDELHGMI